MCISLPRIQARTCTFHRRARSEAARPKRPKEGASRLSGSSGRSSAITQGKTIRCLRTSNNATIRGALSLGTWSTVRGMAVPLRDVIPNRHPTPLVREKVASGEVTMEYTPTGKQAGPRLLRGWTRSSSHITRPTHQSTQLLLIHIKLIFSILSLNCHHVRIRYCAYISGCMGQFSPLLTYNISSRHKWTSLPYQRPVLFLAAGSRALAFRADEIPGISEDSHMHSN